MNITSTEMDTIKSWLNGNRVSEICPACNSSKQMVNPTFLYLAEYHTIGKPLTAADACKLVMTGCTKCGYIRLFGAKVIGV